MKAPVRVAVTGAAGQISYSLIFRIASGSMLGPDQPVILQLLEIPPAMGALQGVLMELNDCAFPLVAGVIATDDPNVAFKDVDFALLVGSRPRGPGMERSDLLDANGAIFTVQGKALSDNAKPSCRVLVVGNPANTNALICLKNAPKLNPRNVTAMMRLDHNRAMSQIAEKTGTHSTKVEKVVVWGNHSATQYPDIATPPPTASRSNPWSPTSGTRTSSSGRAAAGRRHHQGPRGFLRRLRRLRRRRPYAHLGPGQRRQVGEHGRVQQGQPYGVDEDLIFAFPIVCAGGDWKIVEGLEISDFSREMIKKTEAELQGERDAVAKHIKK